MSPALTSEPGSTSTPSRSIRVRGPSPKCRACGPGKDITDDLDAVDYDEFCGVDPGADDRKSKAERKDDSAVGVEIQRISVRDLKDGFFEGRIPGGYVTSLDKPADDVPPEVGTGNKVLVDVREELEYGLCALPGSISESYRDPVVLMHLAANHALIRTDPLENV